MTTQKSFPKEILRYPDFPVNKQQIIPATELKKILFEFNDTASDYPADKCIHQLFEEQVERTPEAIALIWEQEKLTYQSLNQKANQLAHYLQKSGVKPETLVGIFVERSLEMVIGILGILKAGGAYVPLDPKYPSDRIAYMMNDADLLLVLTQSHLLESLPTNQTKVICLDSHSQILLSESDNNPNSCVKPDNLAYVIYTSGSTGKPKGVLIEHRGICNLAVAQIKLFHLEPNSCVLQFASFSFDASVWEMVMGLCSGARLCLASSAALLPGYDLVNLLREQAITHLTLPPSVLAVMPTDDIPTLKYLIVAGEACSAELAARWKTKCHFFNAYGPTESTVCATAAQITQNQYKLSIGSPLPNIQVYILAPDLTPVSIGVPGELHIGGIGLARGYLNRPELTAEKFIENPFNTSERLYKTGDLGRYLLDGNIEFLGRIDNQVKVRGFRIEVGEIESALEQHPNIGQAVIIPVEDQMGDKRLIAYIIPSLVTFDVLRQEIVPQLRGFLQNKLPEYMLPRAFGVLEKFPLTPNGKVDRKALIALPIDSYFSSEKIYVAPSTPQEEILACLVAEILGVERIGIYDNFFELGGDSLKAIVLVNRAQEHLGKNFQMIDFLNAPTIAEFTACLTEKSSSSVEITNSITTSSKTDTVYYPASFLQDRFWSYKNLGSFYHIPNYFHLTGQLDVAILKKSCDEIIRRHEILRTNLQEVNGSLMQVVDQFATADMSVFELQTLPEEEQQKEVERLIDEETKRFVALDKDPWLHITLMTLGEQSHILLICLHHLIADERSTEIFIEELSIVYAAFLLNKPSPLPALSFQYGDYALTQHQSFTPQVQATRLKYWQEWLSQEPPLLLLPTERQLPTVQTFYADTLKYQLSADLSQKLKIFSQQRQVTLFTTILTAFGTLLNHWCNCEDIVVAVPSTNRDNLRLESVIGDFGKMLVLRVKLAGNPSFSELLRRVRQDMLAAIANQDVPLEYISKTLQPSLQRNRPLFRVYLDSLLATPRDKLELPNITVTSLPTKESMARLDLGLIIWEENTAAGTSLQAWWRYKTDLFDTDTIARLSENFHTLLEAIVTNPEQSLDQLFLTEN